MEAPLWGNREHLKYLLLALDSFTQVFMVETNNFMHTLRRKLTLEVSEHQAKLIAHVIGTSPLEGFAMKLNDILQDNSVTGTVSKHKFGEWLKGFGPIDKAVENVNMKMTAVSRLIILLQTSSLLCEPWFHGFITHRETELLLEKEDIGTFLVRFSESRPGAFTLAFVYKHADKGRQVIRSRKEFLRE